MVAWIDSIIVQPVLTTRTAYALHLCLEEAVINVFSHAFEPDTSHDVKIALWRDNQALHVEIIDDGRPLNPLAYELPALPQKLTSANVGGLGIRLMRNFAAQICYQRLESTNRLHLSLPA